MRNCFAHGSGRRIRRGLAALLACILLLALAGCGGSGQKDLQGQKAGPEQGAEDAQAADTQEQDAAETDVGETDADQSDASLTGAEDGGSGETAWWESDPDGADWAETEQDTALLMIRQAMVGTVDVCAVAFLGYLDEDLGFQQYLGKMLRGSSYAEDWTFLEKLPPAAYVECEGSEVYCVIPRDELASVAVNEWVVDESNGFVGEPGEVLYRSDYGHPILLRGNVSDAVPNLQLVIVAEDGSTLEYNPRISLQDGTLDTPGIAPGVLDCTVYEEEDDDRVLEEWELLGSWAGEYSNLAQVPMSGSLEFREDGTMDYCFGKEGQNYTTWYSGNWMWSEDTEGAVVFSMTLDKDDSRMNYPQEFQGVYRITDGQLSDFSAIRIQHLEGQSLSLDGETHDFYLFFAAMG